MQKLNQREVNKITANLNRESECLNQHLLIDKMDSILYEAIKDISNLIECEIGLIDDISNDYLMELRNEITEDLTNNFNVYRKNKKHP